MAVDASTLKPGGYTVEFAILDSKGVKISKMSKKTTIVSSPFN